MSTTVKVVNIEWFWSYYLFGVIATRFTWSSELYSCWREVLHQQWLDKSVHISHAAYNVSNVMASSSTLLPRVTGYAAREWDFNFQFTISRFSNILIYGFYFRVRVKVISVQAPLEETSISGRAQCNVVVVCWCNDFLSLLSGFAVHELAARYVFPSFLSSKR